MAATLPMQAANHPPSERRHSATDPATASRPAATHWENLALLVIESITPNQKAPGTRPGALLRSSARDESAVRLEARTIRRYMHEQTHRPLRLDPQIIYGGAYEVHDMLASVGRVFELSD